MGGDAEFDAFDGSPKVRSFLSLRLPSGAMTDPISEGRPVPRHRKNSKIWDTVRVKRPNKYRSTNAAGGGDIGAVRAVCATRALARCIAVLRSFLDIQLRCLRIT